ncbi:serine/threonine-protein kinase [Nocardia abscessus]|uniref:serine/threonine-protein kinase n=1 Tax=Nocardia abscessus TaxID=120957 RepID=UPI002456C131|nr:serine/threonine-protein kinase [Nocardia abscessus]
MAEVRFEGRDGATWTFDDEAPIGERSGYGTVFKGYDASGQQVAVKRVGADIGTKRLREVAIGNIVTVATSDHLVKPLDVGMVEDDLLIVMPLADESLSKRIQRGPVDIRESLEILRDIALGLQGLAEASLIHRDLKPGNILLLGGRWCIADFGMSRDMNQITAATSQTFKGGGTLPYMAPEIWRLEGETVKTDLYAFGIVAYQILTGRLPSNAIDPSAWRRFHLTESAPELPSNIPPAIRRLVLRLLDKEPAKRPQDARYAFDVVSQALSRPLTSIEVELQEGAYSATLRAAQRASADAAHAASVIEAEGRRIQAVSDLDEIVESAIDLTETLDGVESERLNKGWILRWSDAYVRLQLFSQVIESVNHHAARALRRSISVRIENTIVAAGAVYDNVTDSPQGEVFPAANIVCENTDGRLVWKIWRFKHASFEPRNYVTYEGRIKLGPTNRVHGMVEQAFQRELKYILSPPSDGARDPWTLDIEELTAESLVKLLITAIDGL